MRGWPVTLTEPDLLDAPVGLRPVRAKDAAIWRETRIRNAAWLRPWEPTNPETPLYQTNLGPYIAMARTMRREARQGQTLPWVITYAGRFAGQLTVGSILWGSARTAQVGYWVEEGLRRRSLHIEGTWRDHLCYALTAEDVQGGLLPRWRSAVSASRSQAR